MAYVMWRDYNLFADAVRTDRRYVLRATAKRFLEEVRLGLEGKAAFLRRGEVFWRAALDHASEQEYEHDPELDFDVPTEVVPIAADENRMRPRKDRAMEGRVNPKGIPCLYMATDKRTAMSEVRPWHGALVSVASFKLTSIVQVTFPPKTVPA